MGYLIPGHLMNINRGKRCMNNSINDITKEYNKMFKVIVYKKPFTPVSSSKSNSKVRFMAETDKARSVRRSRAIIRDYVYCNDFDLFVTFTFSPKKVSRYDMNVVYTTMQRWLAAQNRKYDNFKYIIVPEKHKDGAIHFHALISGYEGELIKTKVIQNSRRVYNLRGFSYGFTNAQYLDIDDSDKTIAYLCKYITKDMQTVAQRRRYWCSKNLNKPVISENTIYKTGIANYLDFKNVDYETDFNVVYRVSKSLDLDLSV